MTLVMFAIGALALTILGLYLNKRLHLWTDIQFLIRVGPSYAQLSGLIRKKSQVPFSYRSVRPIGTKILCLLQCYTCFS